MDSSPHGFYHAPDTEQLAEIYRAIAVAIPRPGGQDWAVIEFPIPGMYTVMTVIEFALERNAGVSSTDMDEEQHQRARRDPPVPERLGTHDAWIVGDQPCVCLNWTGARTYAN